MKFREIPVEFKKGQVVTLLYHSPFDHNLFYLICLAKTGLKIRLIIDDIDNLGVDRINGSSRYVFAEKYFFSKTERTNIRSLSLSVPKHLLANLAYPSLKELDSQIGILKLKNELNYKDKVEHWIQDTTRRLGTHTIVGPNKAFAFSLVDQDFVDALDDARRHIVGILSRFASDGDTAVQFINWLLDDQITIGETISGYYFRVLNRLIVKFELEETVSIERMSDISLQHKNVAIMKKFSMFDDLRRLYFNALSIDGKKDEEDYPFYSISKSDGERLLPVENYLRSPDEYIIAPKVLMLNNFENLILPYSAIDSTNVHARELMYSNREINCSQVFCDDRWFDWIASFDIVVNLDKTEAELYGNSKMTLQSLRDIHSSTGNAKQQYRDWVAMSTIKAFNHAKYPIIFLALLQEKVFYKEMPNFYKLSME